MTIPLQKMVKKRVEDTDWSLTSQQMLFLMQNHNTIEAAYSENDLDFLRRLAASEDFLNLFGDMGFDEAYDRYETMLEAGDAT